MARRRKEPKGKKINPTLFIFCEGETEVAYINFLKSVYRIPSIQIHPKISRNDITSRYIENYKQGKPTHEKDLDFLMYDIDVPGIIDRLNKITGGIQLLSNPCIELWFLLHYKNQNARISGERCCQELKNRNRGYKKGVIDKRLEEKLVSRINDATKRAQNLLKSENPSSSVYQLIEILDKLKK